MLLSCCCVEDGYFHLRLSMPKVHVLTNKMHADPSRLADAVAVVVDIVFATTSIAIALERGAREVVPMIDAESARLLAGTLPSGSFVLAGERDGSPLPGFTEPWPRVLLRHELAGKRLVYRRPMAPWRSVWWRVPVSYSRRRS